MNFEKRKKVSFNLGQFVKEDNSQDFSKNSHWPISDAEALKISVKTLVCKIAVDFKLIPQC